MKKRHGAFYAILSATILVLTPIVYAIYFLVHSDARAVSAGMIALAMLAAQCSSGLVKLRPSETKPGCEAPRCDTAQARDRKGKNPFDFIGYSVGTAALFALSVYLAFHEKIYLPAAIMYTVAMVLGAVGEVFDSKSVR